ncbi:MAG: hypothetical protein ACR2QG_09900 [Gammaproteobacteria bacterium]
MHHLYAFSSRTLTSLVTVISLAVLTGCAAKTSVSSGYAANDLRNPRYQRVLIVAIAASPDRRLSFEKAVVEDLAINGTEAWPSAQLMNTELKINQDTLRGVVDQQQADAIIVTRVSAMEVTPVEVEGRSAIKVEEQQSGESHVFKRKPGTLFRYDYEEEFEQSYITTEYTTELTTEVFAADSNELVYTVVSSVSKVETINEVIGVLSDEIAKRLRRDGVVQ